MRTEKNQIIYFSGVETIAEFRDSEKSQDSSEKYGIMIHLKSGRKFARFCENEKDAAQKAEWWQRRLTWARRFNFNFWRLWNPCFFDQDNVLREIFD